MAMQLTSTINPRGNTVEQRQTSLVIQLKQQNEQLKVIIEDLYKEIEFIKKGEK